MKFADLKSEAKAQLNPHYGFFLLLLIPTYAVSGLNAWLWSSQASQLFSSILVENSNVANGSINNVNSVNTSNYVNNVLSLLATSLLLSAMFVMIKAMRGQESDFTGGFSKAFNIFTKGDYFFGAFVVGLLKNIYILLWSILSTVISVIAIVCAVLLVKQGILFAILLFAGILIAIATMVLVFAKQLAYSQSQYIFRDAIDSGNPIGYNEAITKSRKLMNGHKGELFLLILSFILWYLLSAITLGIAGVLYVTPYTKLTYANYYVKLVDSENK
ncbi:DUF975 family protein [Lactobacillus sp. Sy-1]|uniref:DUF975 family protein n=1 Tax=Lactobacillus sp. Sy-1 TaxID=2109645 RepID=UPI001C59CBE0|nr:DUF975 family protein [Lactobacillus sp. Sy-1]MBW1605107.1 DUF975 family protein [Lactobacillus sp. Sy-1]